MLASEALLKQGFQNNLLKSRLTTAQSVVPLTLYRDFPGFGSIIETGVSPVLPQKEKKHQLPWKQNESLWSHPLGQIQSLRHTCQNNKCHRLSRMQVDFLRKLLRLNSNIVTSFCVQKVKVGCGFIQEAFRGGRGFSFLEWREWLILLVAWKITLGQFKPCLFVQWVSQVKILNQKPCVHSIRRNLVRL